MRVTNAVIVTSFLWLLVSFWNRNDLPRNIDYVPELLNEPLQTITGNPSFEASYNGVEYLIEPEYEYDLYGMIVSYRHHDGESRMHRAANDHLNMLDVYVDGGPGPDMFGAADQTLRNHPIRQGRVREERVDSAMTFTGQAIQITQSWEPLLVFGPDAKAQISLDQAFQQGAGTDWPEFSVGGWVHGAAREWDRGRVVFLGEAAMCSAQVSGPERRPMGMNDPRAGQNAQFCLNVVRWLTRVIDP